MDFQAERERLLEQVRQLQELAAQREAIPFDHEEAMRVAAANPDPLERAREIAAVVQMRQAELTQTAINLLMQRVTVLEAAMLAALERFERIEAAISAR